MADYDGATFRVSFTGPATSGRDSERRLRRARRDRRHRTAFRIHAVSFVATQLFLVLTWYVLREHGGTHFLWFVFPLAGWTILLAAHFAAIADIYRRGRLDGDY